MDGKHEPVFPNITTHVDDQKVSSKWYQKPADIGTILNFRSWAPLKHEKNLPFVPPNLAGAYYLRPAAARAICLHNDLLCNGMCSLTGESITYRKEPKFQLAEAG